MKKAGTFLILFLFANQLVTAQKNYLFTWGSYYTFDLGDSKLGPMPAKNDIKGEWMEIAPASMQGYGAGILDDGSLWLWRASDLASASYGITPIQYGTATDWASVIAMRDNYLLLKKDGTLWKLCLTIYYGCHTQIGTDSDWKEIGGKGTSKVMGLKNDGTLWVINTDNGDISQYGEDNDWKTIKKGNGYLGIKENGNLWSTEMPTIPFEYSGPDIHNIKDISYNSQFLVVRNDGTLWVWGWNKKGELGLGYTSQYFQENPVQVGTETNWTTVSAGNGVSFAVKTDGTLWSWGSGENYYLGNQDAQARLQPSQVMDGGNDDWLQVFGGYFYAMGLRSSNQNMNVTAIEKQEKPTFRMYPNPATTIVKIENIKKNSRLIISDLSGKTIFEERLQASTKQTQIDVSQFSKGIYLVKIENATGIYVEKLVIE